MTQAGSGRGLDFLSLSNLTTRDWGRVRLFRLLRHTEAGWGPVGVYGTAEAAGAAADEAVGRGEGTAEDYRVEAAPPATRTRVWTRRGILIAAALLILAFIAWQFVPPPCDTQACQQMNAALQVVDGYGEAHGSFTGFSASKNPYQPDQGIRFGGRAVFGDGPGLPGGGAIPSDVVVIRAVRSDWVLLVARDAVSRTYLCAEITRTGSIRGTFDSESDAPNAPGDCSGGWKAAR